MKIKKIISLCKNAGQFILYSDSVRNMQWLSDGIAIYPLQGCPVFDEDSFCNTYEINGTQRSKLVFRINEPLPTIFDFNDVENFETETVKMPLSVNYSSYDTIAFKTQYSVEFVSRAHLQPFSDYTRTEITFALRTNEAGQSYFAVKNGFMLVGIILPVKVIDRSFISELNAFTKLIEATYYNQLEGSKENRQIEMTGDIANE